MISIISVFHTLSVLSFVFFFNDTATTEIYTLSLHDALPIWLRCHSLHGQSEFRKARSCFFCLSGSASNFRRTPSACPTSRRRDRKSTRLNSSHANISYAVFCLKKKKKHTRK